ncbi:caprin-2 isoform X2 [Corythoichthys intestinalis]|uniref:caprin-2 isoform X2 n=1 Tax=Corythoichthys intestinalis TaxID=161448 RepID=UPI0025A658BF|nr:caprin-2 isoform X2 [Corythoichthys intestinalis]
MVQLPPSPTMGVTITGELSEDRKETQDGTCFEFPTAYYEYESYIENGLICLKHKVRNLEKKKLKLEHYKRRLDRGEALNKDQVAAVATYEQVVHNLEFARELHKVLDSLTQSLLRSQKKALKKEQLVKMEADRRRLSTVLKVQQILTVIQEEHVQKDLLNGRNQAPYLPEHRLNSLSQLANLLGARQDDRLGSQQRMERAAGIYMDLLEGKEEAVAGSTFKSLKEELTKLFNYNYFFRLPPKATQAIVKVTHTAISKEASKAKRQPYPKSLDVQKGFPGILFNSSTLPKDPTMRKKHLEDLMTEIHGSFNFIQDSLLDYDSSSENGHYSFTREPSELSSPPGALRNSIDVLPKEMHSTPLPARILDSKTALTNVDQCLKNYRVEISSNESLHLPEQKTLSSPLFCTQEPAITVEPKCANSSTQTPPEFAAFEDDAQTCVFQSNFGPLCVSKDSQSQHVCGCGGQHHSSVWRNASQVSSPDQEEEFTAVDSGHGDSLPVSLMEVPHSPHRHDHASVLPVHLYPLSQPLRVAFTASRTANFAPANLDQPIIFDQLHSNLGEMFDTHIGRFTCPVNGIYVFMFHILKLAINVPLYINLMCNEEVMVSAYANDGAPDHETASNHAILPLFQGDQVWLRLHRGAIYGSTWKYSTFSGFLLYQD